MKSLKFQSVSLTFTLFIALLVSSGTAHAITKCQDSEGKWHYGDTAASICGDTKITIIDDSGRKLKEIEEPLTVEEINARKAEEKRKKLEDKEKAKRDMEKKRILAIYPTEDSIVRARDDRLEGMDKNIRLQGRLLETMRQDLRSLLAKTPPSDEKAKKDLENRISTQRENIDHYYRAILQLRRERERSAEKYKEILMEFRDLISE